MLQGEAGKAQRSKHDQQHRDNLVRLRGEKQRDIDRLRTGLEDCQACLAVSQAKEQALSSRKRMLEKEVRADCSRAFPVGPPVLVWKVNMCETTASEQDSYSGTDAV